MATYKKQLKDQNGDNIIPALGTATVTGTNIDWSTVIETVGSGNNICYKFPDGLMIACVRVDTSYTLASWSGWYESQAINPPDFAQAFIAVPFCTASIASTNAQCVIGSGSGHSGSSSAVTATRGQTVVVCRPNNVGGNISIVWQAIGRWK